MNKVNIPTIKKAKGSEQRLVCLTAYDCPTARMLDNLGIDIILVGDSVGNVLLGYEDTIPVTLEDIIHHTKAAKKGIDRAFLVADMPFMSYQSSISSAVENAGRLVKEAGAQAVKIEGATPYIMERIRAVIEAGIPVMGHIGLTPQSVNQIGGYKLQGSTYKSAKELISLAKELDRIGVFSMVLEYVPVEVARAITKKVSVPTIGIGAGPDCDGQILVTQDMLGFDAGFSPKFVKQYANVGERIKKAISLYIKEVKSRDFPDSSHSYSMKSDELKKLKKIL